MKYTPSAPFVAALCAVLFAGCGEPVDNDVVPLVPEPEMRVLEPEPQIPDDLDDPPLSPGAREGVCPSFSSCGGDIVGSWQWQSWCQAPQSLLESCSGAQFDTLIEPTGTLSIDEDGTYEIRSSLVRHDGLVAPKGCNLGRECEDMATLLNESEVGGWACADDEAGVSCACQSDQTKDANESGIWISEGRTITLVSDSGDQRFFGYCVSGAGLTLQELTAGQIPVQSMLIR